MGISIIDIVYYGNKSNENLFIILLYNFSTNELNVVLATRYLNIKKILYTSPIIKIYDYNDFIKLIQIYNYKDKIIIKDSLIGNIVLSNKLKIKKYKSRTLNRILNYSIHDNMIFRPYIIGSNLIFCHTIDKDYYIKKIIFDKHKSYIEHYIEITLQEIPLTLYCSSIDNYCYILYSNKLVRYNVDLSDAYYVECVGAGCYRITEDLNSILIYSIYATEKIIFYEINKFSFIKKLD